MARRLDRTVILRRGSRLHTFLPGEEIPDWAAALMTPRPGWGEEDHESSQPVLTTPAADQPDAGEPDVEHPPTSGPGSGRKAWADYAADLGIEVTAEMSRADIITAVEDAGHSID